MSHSRGSIPSTSKASSDIVADTPPHRFSVSAASETLPKGSSGRPEAIDVGSLRRWEIRWGRVRTRLGRLIWMWERDGYRRSDWLDRWLGHRWVRRQHRLQPCRNERGGGRAAKISCGGSHKSYVLGILDGGTFAVTFRIAFRFALPSMSQRSLSRPHCSVSSG
jgi:hypothetical protein